MSSRDGTEVPANDAQLAQLVRGSLVSDPRTRDLPRVNVSSCKFVVTLHGAVPDGNAATVEAITRDVPGVKGTVNKLGGAGLL